jgi:hypothetical protein
LGRTSGHTPSSASKRNKREGGREGGREAGFYLKESGERGFCNKKKRRLKRKRKTKKLEEKYIAF